VRLIASLYRDIEQHGDSFRGDRAPDDPECFVYTLMLRDGGRLHTGSWFVNDTQETVRLSIKAISHVPGKELP
jgi:hypothetical protein